MSVRLSAFVELSIMPCTVKAAVRMTAMRISRTDSPVAAKRGRNHRRYHGCTTGPRTTMTPRARAAPRTGLRPPGRNTRSAMRARAAAIPMSRTMPRTVAGSSVQPIHVDTMPSGLPMAVVGESQVRTPEGVPKVALITPVPASAMRNTEARVQIMTTPVSSQARMRRSQVASRPAQSRPENGRASRAMGLMVEARVMATAPQEQCRSAASARPVTTRPTMSASLWAPATKCMRTTGLRTPSHSARAGSTPCRRASRGT